MIHSKIKARRRSCAFGLPPRCPVTLPKGMGMTIRLGRAPTRSMLSTTLEDDDDRDGQAHQSSGRVDAGPIQRESQHAGGAHRGQPHGHPAEQGAAGGDDAGEGDGGDTQQPGSALGSRANTITAMRNGADSDADTAKNARRRRATRPISRMGGVTKTQDLGPGEAGPVTPPGGTRA
jgi:hypothetical protein